METSDINNLELITPLLRWNSEDDFYDVMIYQRNKEHPGLHKSVNVIRNYQIRSLEHLNSKFGEIKLLADYYNARVGINLNKKSYRKAAFQTLKKITDCMLNEDYKAIAQSYHHAVGVTSNESPENKKWIVDIDTKDRDEINEISKLIVMISREYNIAEIPTKNGVHVITHPFRQDEFRKLYTKPLDIHKNNHTLLYQPLL